MSAYEIFIIFLTVSELALIILIIMFFSRLRKSEELVNKLQKNQDALLKKIDFNARLEQELVTSFQKRQSELAELDQKLEERKNVLEKLVSQARDISRSPEFLRQTIITGRRKGRSVPTLAKATGLSEDEVELILDQASTEIF